VIRLGKVRVILDRAIWAWIGLSGSPLWGQHSLRRQSDRVAKRSQIVTTEVEAVGDDRFLLW